ncbi:phage adaptor protein [Klebsiella quasivariicola]|uniref:phage adaptor protein n=1 Tax=Klebsiella quasivariicola TaxID=2026240 RepID=UPI002479D72C|nr:hypothetical protein [Klebsiella quasivariicola]
MEAMPTIGQRIDTYQELVEAVQLWADRDDDEFVNEIPVFIDFAEREAYRLLTNSPAAEKEAYLEIINGWAYIPSDFLTGKYMRLIDNPWMSVRESTFDEVRMLNGSDPYVNTDGVKEIVFCSIGPRFAFYPQSLNCPLPTENPDGSVTTSGAEMVMDYICDPMPLGEDNPTNYMLTLAPEVLLYGALKHAAMFTKDADAQGKWEDMQKKAAKELAYSSKRSRLSFNGMVVPTGNIRNFF